ncbi:Peptide methionine sulfoxide reductase A2-1, partial [Coemansia sp. RSA 2424]
DQRKLAEASKQKVQEDYQQPITTEILPAGVFYPAEAYHQRYLEKGGQCASKGCDDNIRCYG